MYAVIKTGGKQYKVAPGETIKVEKLAGDAGNDVVINEVLMVVDEQNVQVGRPNLDNASVVASVKRHGIGKKVVIMKNKRRSTYHVKRGHRQLFTELEIKEIRV